MSALLPPENFVGVNSTSVDSAVEELSGYSWHTKLPLLVALPLLIVTTIFGNVLVCLAVFLVPKIREQPYTLLYVSLAVADLFVAVLVMPIALLHLYSGRWTLGRTLCDLFVSADVLSCTASILNLCAISVDRYRAITSPLMYSQQRGHRLMYVYIGGVWSGAICISLVPIAIIGNEHGHDDICMVSQNIYYQVWATLMSFYIPLAVMIFVYMKILRAARRIVRQERRAQGHLPAASSVTPNQQADDSLTGPEISRARQSTAISLCQHVRQLLRECCVCTVEVPREKKASVTLGIIMTAFIFCWLPFFILAVLQPLLPVNTLPASIVDIFLWLGYLNSFLNPVIYVTFNKDFRRPFKEILCLRCCSLKAHLRQEHYLEQYGESHRSLSSTKRDLEAAVLSRHHHSYHHAAQDDELVEMTAMIATGKQLCRSVSAPCNNNIIARSGRHCNVATNVQINHSTAHKNISPTSI